MGEGQLIAASTATVSVENEYGAYGSVENGAAGISFSEEPFRFDVDCFSGSCLVRGDLGGEVMLHTGERAFVDGSGKPGAVEPARYDLYASLPNNDEIQFPTATATPTNTPVPTSTSSPTSTPTPVRTQIPTSTRRSTATATATFTAVPQFVARPTPKLSVFPCNRPGQFSPSQTIPFQWTWSGTLGRDEYLELRIGPQGSTNLTSIGTVPTDANVTWLVDASRFYQSTAFDYHWEIVHMAKNRTTVLARSERGCLHVAPE